MQLLWYLSVGIVLWRAVSYGLPRSFKPENISNEHGKPENGIINRRGHIWKLGESASVTVYHRAVQISVGIHWCCFKRSTTNNLTNIYFIQSLMYIYSVTVGGENHVTTTTHELFALINTKIADLVWTLASRLSRFSVSWCGVVFWLSTGTHCRYT